MIELRKLYLQSLKLSDDFVNVPNGLLPPNLTLIDTHFTSFLHSSSVNRISEPFLDRSTPSSTKLVISASSTKHVIIQGFAPLITELFFSRHLAPSLVEQLVSVGALEILSTCESGAKGFLQRIPSELRYLRLSAPTWKNHQNWQKIFGNELIESIARLKVVYVDVAHNKKGAMEGLRTVLEKRKVRLVLLKEMEFKEWLEIVEGEKNGVEYDGEDW